MEWRVEILRNLLDDPIDPSYYLGWRRKLGGAKQRMADMFKQARSGRT